jgi:hypothetical protein
LPRHRSTSWFSPCTGFFWNANIPGETPGHGFGIDATNADMTRSTAKRGGHSSNSSQSQGRPN